MQVEMGEDRSGDPVYAKCMLKSSMFISVFDCKNRKGSGKKIRKQKFSYLGPG